VHEVAREDIERDKDQARRQISLSKIAKFQSIAKVRGLTKDQLESEFGPLSKANDVVDATLLHALKIGVADFLVTQDGGLHDRARRYAPDIAGRVLFVADATLLLRATYEPTPVALPFVEEVDAHSIPLADPIFDSLREGYPDFDTWWQEKCVKQLRKCWVVTDEGSLAGIIVRKDESSPDTDAQTEAARILKICTFKVMPERRGIKLGELLLKQVFWFAQRNGYDLLYLTTYPSQAALIDLIEFYGFQATKTAADGEITFEKTMGRTPLAASKDDDLFKLAARNYPRFHVSSQVLAYGIPIKEEFHESLFPELKDASQPGLFEFAEVGTDARRPGNTIRKVYLCRAPAKIEQPGALLLFYKGSSAREPSQAITTVGVFENMTLAHSTEELRRLAGGRSVYNERQLLAWNARAEAPVKVINFLLAGHISPAMSLDELLHEGVIDGHPPQSIFRLSDARLRPVLARLDLGFPLQ